VATQVSSSEAPASGGTWRLRSYLLDRDEFNEMRRRLPRAARRDVQAAPEGHVGLVAQAFVGDEAGTPLWVVYDSVPASLASEGLRRLEQRLAEKLA
jgi:hypothetical protein